MTDEVFGLDELENASKRKLKETFAKVFSRPKEELKKEAEESAKKFFGKPTDLVDLDNLRIFKNGYLASAEPREKQIEIDAEHIRDLQKQNGELTDKAKELEAQLEREKNLSQCRLDHNEQLREMIEKMKCCSNCTEGKTMNGFKCEDCEGFSNWQLKESK